MYYKCCVPGCVNLRKDAILHKFPKCQKRLKMWLDNINCDSLRQKSVYMLRTTAQVCHKHFEPRFLTKTSHLRINAYPTLFLDSEILDGKPQSPRIAECPDQTVDHHYTKKKHIDHSYCKQESHLEQRMEIPENLSPRVSSPCLEETPSPILYFAPFGDENGMDDVEVTDSSHDASMKASIAEMREHQEQLQTEVFRLRTELLQLQDLKLNQILETESLQHLINKTMEVLMSSSKENGMLRARNMELELELEQLRDQVKSAEKADCR